MLKEAAAGCGVTSPFTVNEPVPLMRVSRATLTGFARSRLAPLTSSDNGASTTLTAGCMVRSSAEMLASCSSNRPRSHCHARCAAAALDCEATAVAFAGTGGAGGDGCAGRSGAGGAAASFSKFKTRRGSRQAVNFMPLNDSESTCARRFARSTVAAVNVARER